MQGETRIPAETLRHLEGEGFRLLRVLGRGFSGEVLEAFSEPTGTAVALKVLLPGKEDPERFLDRFRREWALLDGNPHPDLVTLLDAHLDEPPYYLVLELLAGGSLSPSAGSRRLPPEEVVQAAAAVARALSFLHANGVVHRDVKPANVLRRADGPFKLADLGLGRGPASSQLTRTGDQVGTLAYLAPELLKGAPHTPRSDLFALGVMTVELLLGARPAVTPLGASVRWKDLARFGSDDLVRLLEGLLASEPSRRPESAERVAEALSRIRLAPVPVGDGAGEETTGGGATATMTQELAPVMSSAPRGPAPGGAAPPGAEGAASRPSPRTGWSVPLLALGIGLVLGAASGGGNAPRILALGPGEPFPAPLDAAGNGPDPVVRTARRRLGEGARVVARADLDPSRTLLAIRRPEPATGSLEVAVVAAGVSPDPSRVLGERGWTEVWPSGANPGRVELAADPGGSALRADGLGLVLLDDRLQPLGERPPGPTGDRLLGLTPGHVWLARPGRVMALARPGLGVAAELAMEVGPDAPVLHRAGLYLRTLDGTAHRLDDGIDR